MLQVTQNVSFLIVVFGRVEIGSSSSCDKAPGLLRSVQVGAVTVTVVCRVVDLNLKLLPRFPNLVLF